MACVYSLIGYATVAFLVFKLLKAVYVVIFPYLYAVPQNILVLSGAKWAVITGSTDGIGKAYAFELAKKGLDICLISRSPDKLKAVAEELKGKSPNTQVKTIAFDFTNANLADYQKQVFSELERLEVGVLVNNVGLSYEYPERLDKLEGGLQRITDITVINTLPTTLLSAFVLAQMAKRRRGVVINVASAASYHPLFYWAIYSATKKYVCHLSDILRQEYSGLGITIQTICPMMVATKMSKVRKSSFFTPNPEQFVKQAVRSIGHVSETTGCLPHQIQAELIFGMLPNMLLNKLTTDQSLQTRSRALKKKEGAGSGEPSASKRD